MTIISDQLNFENAANVISSAQKLIIPIPELKNGEPLIYPEIDQATGKRHEKAGQPIVDYKGNPIGSTGVVFYNGKDKATQAVPGDGTGVVIINQVDQDTATRINNVLVKHNAYPKEGVTALNIGAALNEIAAPVLKGGLGMDDMYNSTQDFVKSKMTHVDQGQEYPWLYGLFKRDDRDICQAVYIPGRGEFQGPAADAQKFSNGAVIIKQGDSIRLVQPEIFEQTYKQANGGDIKVSMLPVQEIDTPNPQVLGGTQELSSPVRQQHRGAVKGA